MKVIIAILTILKGNQILRLLKFKTILKLLCCIKRLPAFTLQAQRLKCLCVLADSVGWNVLLSVVTSGYTKIVVEGNSILKAALPLSRDRAFAFFQLLKSRALHNTKKTIKKQKKMKYHKTFTYRLTFLSTCAQYVWSFNALSAFCHDWFYSLLTQF